MIGVWMETQATGRNLTGIVSAPAEKWVACNTYNAGGGCGCMAYHAGLTVTLSDRLFGLWQAPSAFAQAYPELRCRGRYEGLCRRFGKDRVVGLIRQRAANILARRVLVAMPAVERAVPA